LVTPDLDKIFSPKSIALVGASDKEGSVGYTLIKNLTELGNKAKVYPVNIRKKKFSVLKPIKLWINLLKQLTSQ